MKKCLITIAMLIAFSLPVPLQAAFPPDHYPDGAHSRLWLTAERLAVFDTARNQNTDRWQDFKYLCDTLIDADPDNDPWNIDGAPQHYTAPLALMYRLTGDARYADRALALMDGVHTNFDQYAEPDHESYQYLGLTYDWLHAYSGLTAARKTAYQAMMKTISDQFWNGDNLNASGTDSDKNLLTMTIHLILGAALYGDTPDAVAMLDHAWHGWQTGYFLTSGVSNLGLIQSSLGGAYFAGFDYFNATDGRGIAEWWLSMQTACNYDINVEHPGIKSFWANIVRSAIHLTDPLRQTIYHYSSWQDPNRLSEQNYMRRSLALAAYYATQAGNSAEAALARGFADEVDVGYHSDVFTLFFFDMPNATAASPYNGAMPLTRFADEPDFLMFRDNWSQSANWGLFIGDGSIPFDHQSPDHGHFVIWRGDDYLTKGARSYESMANGDFFNTLSIASGCSLNGVDCSGTAIFDSELGASISRHRTQDASPLFAYGMLEADGQWNQNPAEYEPLANVKSYRRHFFWSKDYVVVFDRLRQKTPASVSYRLRAMREPLISGTTVSQLSANGAHKLLQRTLEPAGVSIQKVDETVLWAGLDDWIVNDAERKWQSVIGLPAATDVNMLNVIQTGPASMSGFDTLAHISGNGNAGVRIGHWVVIFASEEHLRSTVDYQVSDAVAGMWHLVGDLAAGAYDVWVNGQTVSRVMVAKDDHTALFQLNPVSGALAVKLTLRPDSGGCKPAIRANSQAISLNVDSSESVRLSVSLDAAAQAGQLADWWLLSYGPDKILRYFNLNSMNFIPGSNALFQYQLLSFDELPLLQLKGMDAGQHLFLFGIDTLPNLALDVDVLAYDMVGVTVHAE